MWTLREGVEIEMDGSEKVCNNQQAKRRNNIVGCVMATANNSGDF